jgi:hypothetical protein
MKITPQAGSGSLVWIHNLKLSFIQQMPFFVSPNDMPVKTSFSVPLHKPLWKKNLIKDMLTQVKAHCTGPIKPWMHHSGLGNKHLMKAQEGSCGTSIPSEGTEYTWPFKWTLSCYSFMPACSVIPPKGNWNRHANGLIKHIKSSLYHIWRWFCWAVAAQSSFQSNSKWALSHSHTLTPCPWRQELQQDLGESPVMETNGAHCRLSMDQCWYLRQASWFIDQVQNGNVRSLVQNG